MAYVPNVDAIQEFNVITNNPSAEFGHFLGGVINVSTKSGTNQFHGNLFEFLRNDFFNANEWSNNFNGLPTPRQRWNEYGGTFGGPVKEKQALLLCRLPGIPLRPAGYAVSQDDVYDAERKRQPVGPRHCGALSGNERGHALGSD